MLDVVKFESLNWIEIPKEENPVFRHIGNNDTREREKACILLCKVLPYEDNVGKDGYVVIYVPEKGEITRLGLFWKLGNAELFAHTMSQAGPHL